MKTHEEKVRNAAFGFARRLGDPEFRRYLREKGKQADQKIICSYHDEPPELLIERFLSDTEGWAENFLLCIADANAPFGWRVSVQTIPWRRWATEYLLSWRSRDAR